MRASGPAATVTAVFDRSRSDTRSSTEQRLAGGDQWGLMVLNLEPHLVIGNVSAWQASDSSWRKNPLHNQPAAITSRRGPLKDRAVAGLVTPVGLGPPCVTSPAELSHPD